MIFPSQIKRAREFRAMGTSSDLMELISISRWIYHAEHPPLNKKVFVVDEEGLAMIKAIYLERIVPVIESTDKFVEQHDVHRLTLSRLIAFSSLASLFTPEYAAKHFLPIKLKGFPDDWSAGPSF